jgi:hypothetical protein
VRRGLKHQVADADDPAKRHQPFFYLFFAKELQALFKNLKQIAARFQTNCVNQHPGVA